MTPIRFVCACDKGHLQDIDWRWVVHGSGACHEPMWVEEKGTSADPADTSIVCGCGRRLSLQDTFQPGRLGKCRGERPWLLDRDPEGCGDNLKLLTRTATNTYFPQVHTVISLPTEEDELSQLVDELSGDLAGVQTVQDVAQAKRFNPKVSASLGPYSDGDIFDRLQRIREGARIGRHAVAQAVRVRYVCQRPAGDRREPSNRKALRPDSSARGLGRPRCRDRSIGDQKPGRGASPEGGVVPLRVHAI